MAYQGLGSRPTTATTTSGFAPNGSNWTAVLDSSDINIHVPFFEIYRASFMNGPAGSTISIYVDNDLVSVSPAGDGAANSWAPPIAHELTPGNKIYFCWDKATGVAPTATAFFRYDPLARIM